MHRIARIALAAAAAAALAGFGSCGGSDGPPTPPGFFTLHVRGAVDEDLQCIVAAQDYSQYGAGFPDAGMTEWMLVVSCYRSITQQIDMVAGLGLTLAHAPSLGAPYAFTGSGASDTAIDGAEAQRYDSITMGGATGPMTHEALYMPGLSPVGSLSFTFTAIPGPGGLPTAVHGSIAGTLPPTAGGGYTSPVTVSGTF